MKVAAFRVTALAFFCVLAVGCASAPETRYFTLDDAHEKVVTEGEAIAVRPVRVPDYLDDNRIWVRPDAHRVEPLPHVRWAEPMPRAITRSLKMYLGGVSEAERPRQLLVDIHRFEAIWGQPDRVVLVAQWRLQQHSGGVCRIELDEPLSDRDAATLVAAKGRLVTELANRIGTQVAGGEPGC